MSLKGQTASQADLRFMALALSLARRGLGQVSPNPAVGCVIVDRDGLVAGRGWTQKGGRPHAETEAIAQAGSRARGATAYVSLEPCAHHGVTGPCAQALIAAGVSRVVSAAQDPDPRVAGKGHAMLREAGIAVLTGVMEREALLLNEGFILRVTQNRPLVILKIAMSIDGRIATASGQSQWITGEAARAHGHMLRAQSDAILIGAGTALADDPLLTCRIPGLEARSPLRVVAAGTRPFTLPKRLAESKDHGEVLVLDTSLSGGQERPEPVAMLSALSAKGVTRLLIEGGSTISGAFLRAGLVDVLYAYRGAALIGADGLAATSQLGAREMAAVRRFRLESVTTLGDDVVEVFRPRA
ncbi:MAG TPA: bifunctional diaminohydroxyphosphoribosylaminopyrimidine deaminase/5-amino-6-(5-phosphoribosylamino)uracil reductase RibD [Micropepsaceae bacterium]|nr:bifunctional diaminohydroxyphosphoribosylaminopyrimidine deaminase/5-amino-6-(5-phosphoribosylamino)uracil reductase RibD [Micropepsaceae bacterium]